MASKADVFLGFDLSTQQLKVIGVDSRLDLVVHETLKFDEELPKYNTVHGVLHNEKEREIFAPVAMWLEALDIVLQRLKDSGFDFSRVKALSGACQQHGSVYWSAQAPELLGSLNPSDSLLNQLAPNAFARQYSPNWQDHSTKLEVDAHENEVGGSQHLAEITGSRGHYRFTGPQIMRVRRVHPEGYARTARISIISSFLASVFLGKWAAIDVSDICGMNLWDITKNDYYMPLVQLVAGASNPEDPSVAKLIDMLGYPIDGKDSLGLISSYFVQRYGFNPDCEIIPFTGDNPATILSLDLQPNDVMISLGTSTTLLTSTEVFAPSDEYHLFLHPTSPGLYMGMLCYCNGGLAREQIRDAIDSSAKASKSWDKFNEIVLKSRVLDRKSPEKFRIGFYFPLSEIIPDRKPQITRFSVENGVLAKETPAALSEEDARMIIESQGLSMRLRSQNMLAGNNGRPRRMYLVGGGSKNPAIAQVLAEVLGPTEGTHRLLQAGDNACALGAAHKAAWAVHYKATGESFMEYMAKHWQVKGRIETLEIAGAEAKWSEYKCAIEPYKNAESLLD
ncbi:hypothetical protein CANCADRAFT_93797 [Tortispora caseinolytica NRRL Y-17796]|uniref:Xylulose kinase n=1 Tax=Tortispora caseinolytica NRRL Y-17796 TaxID=767744 RepID=A0A1E4TM86_9ASCO|nr:hypothetical protein CANCADRAFT_93797 [Tortispora caseinolytica NRRL Y-17796]